MSNVSDSGTVASREEAIYDGFRVLIRVFLGKARTTLQIDIGLGDFMDPAPVVADFPTLLGHAAPRLQVYPREVVIAEKFHAMVEMGLINSRMKDFFDIWYLSKTFSFETERLSKAIQGTFKNRGRILHLFDHHS